MLISLLSVEQEPLQPETGAHVVSGNNNLNVSSSACYSYTILSIRKCSQCLQEEFPFSVSVYFDQRNRKHVSEILHIRKISNCHSEKIPFFCNGSR